MAYCQSQLYVDYLRRSTARARSATCWRPTATAWKRRRRCGRCARSLEEFEKGYRAYLDEVVQTLRGKTAAETMSLKDLEAAHEKEPEDLDGAAPGRALSPAPAQCPGSKAGRWSPGRQGRASVGLLREGQAAPERGGGGGGGQAPGGRRPRAPAPLTKARCKPWVRWPLKRKTLPKPRKCMNSHAGPNRMKASG